MLAPHLARDNRLRAAGFKLDIHTRSGRRFWHVEGGFLLLDPEEADSLIDMLVEHDFLYVSTGLWRGHNGVYTTREAIAEVQREYAFLLKMHESGVQ